MGLIQMEISGVEIRELTLNADSRGWLAEIHRNDETAFRPAMAYVSVTQPGRSRGPHEHRHQTDCFVFAGPGDFMIYLYDHRPASPTHKKSFSDIFGQKRPGTILVPPGVIHAYRCLSAEPGMILNLPDRLYRGEGRKEEVDEIRHENDPSSPFFSVFDRSLFM